ncbi:MAG: carboxymuconolactone decarboxylase family protein [Halorientalis sp.]
MARVPTITRSALPDEYQSLLGEDALGERNVFTTLANNPPILESYMLYGSTLWRECGLSVQDRELAILAVARTLDARYEWEQHVTIGTEAGVGLDAIRAVGSDDLASFDDRRRALLSYVQAVATNSVTDDRHSALEAHFDADAIVGIGMLASHYVATATALAAFDVQLEDPDFVGWTPSEP